MVRIISILSMLLLFSCMGRQADEVSTESVDLTPLGIEKNDRPVVLAYAALWCNPCKAEIDVLNQAATKYENQIDIVGVLVQGQVKGEAITTAGVTQFKSHSGQSPNYAMTIDPNWAFFSNNFKAPKGEQLPTMVFLDKNWRPVYVVQNSMEFENGLDEILQQLVDDQEITNPNQEDEKPTDEEPDLVVDDRIRSFTPSTWEEYVGLLPNTDINQTVAITKNLEQSWKKGALKFGFDLDKVPFLLGRLRATYENDDSDYPIPSSMHWSYKSENGRCSLDIFVNKDGTYLKSQGVCL